jgi:hypothetical protein
MTRFNRCNRLGFDHGYSKEWPRPLHRAEPNHQLQPSGIIKLLGCKLQVRLPFNGGEPCLTANTHVSKQR